MEAGRSQSVTVTHDVDGQVIAPLSERGRLLRRFRLLRGALAVVLMAAAVAAWRRCSRPS